MKTCLKCLIPKEETNFYLQHPARSKTRRKGVCKQCLNNQSVEWAAKNPQRALKNAREYKKRNPDRVENARLKREYGITLTEWNHLHFRQSGRCAGCDEPKKLDVDHSHSTGRIRGLLCRQCNTALGLLKESPSALARLIIYLQNPT